MEFLADDGKIINVSSGAGDLSFQERKVRDKMRNKDMDRKVLLEIAKELEEATKTNSQGEIGWSKHYNNSKCLLNAYTRFVLPKELKQNQSVFALSPGFVKTDMTVGTSASLEPEEGAATPIYLIADVPFERDEKINGEFFRDCKVETYDKSNDGNEKSV